MNRKNKLDLFLCCLLTCLATVSIVFSIVMSKRHADIIYINSEDDLETIRNNLSGHYVVNADTEINITKPWVPIGTKENPFTGYIDFNYKLINLKNGYDQEYIINSCETSSLNLGFFGVNNGTIMHSNFFDFSFCDNLDWSSSIIESLDVFNYGAACAINNGYITGVKGYVKTINIPKILEEINIGGICAINNGQIQGCSLAGDLSVTTCCPTNVGCLCGIQEKKGIIKYCFNSGKSYYVLTNGECNTGFCVGLCKGGNINNVGLSYSSDISTRNTSRIQSPNNDSLISFGALIGKIELDSDLSIRNIVCDLELENTYVNNFAFGYISGIVDVGFFHARVENVCISGEANNMKNDSRNSFGLLFGLFNENEKITYSNIYFYDFLTKMVSFNYFNIQSSIFDDLSLSKIKLDEAIWIKGKFHFYLYYEKTQNY